jgi:hypothetical protein
VFWAQVAISFALWVATGFVLMRSSQRIRKHAFSVPRTLRGLLSAALFALSSASIFGALLASFEMGGFQPDHLKAWAWALITLGGLVCVSSATFGLGYAVSLAMQAAIESRVTQANPAASSKRNPNDS